MNITKALDIPGWMTEQELTWLAERAAESLCILEIGSWRGRSTRALADHTSGVVFAIDTWRDSAIGFPGWWTKKESPQAYLQKDWLWNEFRVNLIDKIGTKVVPLRMNSAQAYDLLSRRGIFFDMIFIDGDHTAVGVHHDISRFQRLLRSGGILSGHDFNDPQCPEVAPAVCKLIPKVDLTGTIWRAA